MIGALLERLAPHWPIEDTFEDGPDSRPFLQRLFAADQQRNEYPRTLLRIGDRLDVRSVVQWTHWGLGIDVESELSSPWADGHVWTSFDLGPLTVTVIYGWPH